MTHMNINDKDGNDKMASKQKRYCMGCMQPLDASGKCPVCDFDLEQYERAPRCIRPGDTVNGRYLLGRVLGEGSFGITYIGRDLVLDRVVAVKEYFPVNYVSRDVQADTTSNKVFVYAGIDDEDYQYGLDKFYGEAKILAKFQKISGVVSVNDFFYDNATAYLVMDYVHGITLKEYIKQHGAMEGPHALEVMHPVIKALCDIHKEGIVHRDISPDNILVEQDGTLVLIDFGSAREERQSYTQSMTVLFKRGYTPEEQYRGKGNWGVWSDVYSLCATMYFMLTSIVPNESIERMIKDDMQSLRDMPQVQLSNVQKDAIMKGVAVKADKRFQNMEQLEEALYGKIGIGRKILGFLRLRSSRPKIAAGVTVLLLLTILIGGRAGYAHLSQSRGANGNRAVVSVPSETPSVTQVAGTLETPAAQTAYSKDSPTPTALETPTAAKTKAPKKTSKPKKKATAKPTSTPKKTVSPKKTKSPTTTKKTSATHTTKKKSSDDFVGEIP